MFNDVLAQKTVPAAGEGDTPASKAKKQLPGLFDVIRILSVVFYFTFTCIWVAFFGLFLKPLTLPLQRKFGIHPSKSPVSYLTTLGSKFFLASVGIFWECTKDESGYPPKAIYMYNHTSNIDVLCINGYVGFASQLYKKALDSFPPLKWMLNSLGGIPIVREKRELALAAVNEAMTATLSEGYSVCLSPEGTRSLNGDLQPFKKGGFHLAVNTKLPVVPIVLSGGYEIWPPTLLFPAPGNLKLRVLQPIYPKEGQTVDEFLAEVEAVFKANPRQKVDPPSVWNHVAPLMMAAALAYGTFCFFSTMAAWIW